MTKIQDFLSERNNFTFPTAPIIKAGTVQEFYEKYIKDLLPKADAIIEWHELLSMYMKDPEAILLSRLYESRKHNDEWDTRRGMLTRMSDGFSYAFTTNFFARIIYTMAYFNFIPDYIDFKNMFVFRKFSLFSFIGKTDVEKKYSAFSHKAYNQKFYTPGWYLAHIVAVNDERFYGHENKNIKDILTPGLQSQWKINSSMYYERFINNKLSDEEKQIAWAHFIRFIDPINYFLVPNLDRKTGRQVGEDKNLINFIQKKFQELYNETYKDFINKSLFNPQLLSDETIEALGEKRISDILIQQKNSSNTIPLEKKLKNNSLSSNTEKTAMQQISGIRIIDNLSQYTKGNIFKGFSETNIQFENEYIKTICFNHSNKWLGMPNFSDMEKMWSIIYIPKKDFIGLKGWQTLCRYFNISVTTVLKGKNTGCNGIRIRGMKQKPNEAIIRQLLNYIFN